MTCHERDERAERAEPDEYRSNPPPPTPAALGAPGARGSGDEKAWAPLWAAQREAVPPDAWADPHRPRPELGGLSVEDFVRLVTTHWDESDSPLRLTPYVDAALLDESPVWRRARGLLAIVHGEPAVALTTHGELPPSLVVRAATELDWPTAQRPTVPVGRLREADLPALTALLESLARARLLDLPARRPYAQLRLTPAGARAVAGESVGEAYGRFVAGVWRAPLHVPRARDPFHAAPGLRGVVPYALWTLATMPSGTPAHTVAERAWPERLAAALGPRRVADATRDGLLGQGAGFALLRLRRVTGRTVVIRTPLLDAVLRTTLPPFPWPIPPG